MVNANILGRYEFYGSTDKGNSSRKFWHIVYDKTNQNYIATYARIGATGTEHIYPADDGKIEKLVRSKVKKGYSKVDGYNETTGANSLHFIMTA